jgi:hypothetical protein
VQRTGHPCEPDGRKEESRQMPQQPPRRWPGGGQDPRRPPWDSGSQDKPSDISEMVTTYLVPSKPLQGIRASRDEQLAAHQTAGDHLRAQQRALARQIADWQNQLYIERSADRRVEIQRQVDNLGEAWSELERQVRAHRQAIRTLRDPDPPPPDQSE